MRNRIITALLCLCLLLSAALPAAAQEQEPQTTRLSISTVQRFLSFAEKCRLDSYSRNLVVSLETDLDLTDVEFQGIPIFCGTFEGNGHTISGLRLSGDGSAQGLFRHLTETALVRDLKVQGDVAPGGSRSEIGGIAGINGGTITGCVFTGSIAGGDKVGGIAGVNQLSGIIEDCRVSGSIYGNHFIGGMAGKSSGVIRGCVNTAAINTTAQENNVSLSDITIENLTTSESANTVTDVGGIAGKSDGVIRSCSNQGNVGYQHMGYNIGGIAGTQSGYVTDCENRGRILGRKEVGGIVGQMEPTALIEYEQDALQILQGQLTAMSGTVSRTAANVQGSADALYNQVGALEGHVQDARNAVGLLIPDPDDPSLPDPDTIQAARNGLSNSLSGMNDSLQNMKATTQSAMGTLSNNLHTLQSQVSAMSATLGSVSETLGGSITDVSDSDTEADLNGKVEACRNLGSVQGDRNIGGITGAIALENDLDVKDDWEIQGSNSLNFESVLRAVVLDCENSGRVTARKQSAGGVVGLQTLGLVKDSRNTGDLDAENAEYVGGITGQSQGYIRASGARCVLTGKKYVGGIAGSASVATDCRSMVKLEGSERLGAVLGWQEDCRDEEEEAPVAGNCYLVVSADYGGIDGVSYDGLAQPLSEKEFFSLEDLPELFRKVTITFLFDGGTERRITVPSGGALKADQIPAIPEKQGYVGSWDGLEEAGLNNLVFNLSFETVYTAYRTAIQSEAVRDNGMPVLLLQGDFPEDAAVTASPSEDAPQLSQGQTLLEVWDIALPQDASVTTARLALPEDLGGEQAALLVRRNGVWSETQCTPDGSYLVFPMGEGDDAVALLQKEASPLPRAALAAGAAAIAGLALLILLRRRKRKAPKPQEQESKGNTA